MNKLMNSLVFNVRIYLIFRRVIRSLFFVAFVCFFGYSLINREKLGEESILKYSEILLIIFAIIEIADLVYKYVILRKSLNDFQEICEDDYKFQGEHSTRYKKMLDEFLSHEHDKNLDSNGKKLIEKEKSGNGHLALNYLKAKVNQSIAHMYLRKIVVLRNATKKWW